MGLLNRGRISAELHVDGTLLRRAGGFSPIFFRLCGAEQADGAASVTADPQKRKVRRGIDFNVSAHLAGCGNSAAQLTLG